MTTWIFPLGAALLYSVWQLSALWLGLRWCVARWLGPSPPLRALAGGVALGTGVLALGLTWWHLVRIAAGAPGTMLASAPWPQVEAWLAALWVLGCVGRLAQLAGRLRELRRLAELAWPPVPDHLERRCRELAERLGVKRPIRYGAAAGGASPVVVGGRAPLMLIPSEGMAGLSAAQRDAILAHELAHIRRHDFAANVVQGVAEAVLFFHPATWSIGRLIRREREYACDDAAATLTGGGWILATALAHLELKRTPPLALAVTGEGELTARIARLLATGSGPAAAAPRRPRLMARLTGEWAVIVALGLAPLGTFGQNQIVAAAPRVHPGVPLVAPARQAGAGAAQGFHHATAAAWGGLVLLGLSAGVVGWRSGTRPRHEFHPARFSPAMAAELGPSASRDLWP